MPAFSRVTPKALAFWPAAGTIVIADFITKRIAEAFLALHVPREVVGGAVRLTLTYNTGAAMNASLGDFSRVGFSTIAAVMIVVLYRMYRSAAPGDAWQSLALGLVSGGAIGNLVDRVRSARGVVDFIDVGTPDWRFWTFNVADAAVTTGAILLALVLFRRGEDPSAAPVAAPATAAVGEPAAAPPRTAD